MMQSALMSLWMPSTQRGPLTHLPQALWVAPLQVLHVMTHPCRPMGSQQGESSGSVSKPADDPEGIEGVVRQETLHEAPEGSETA